MALVTFCMMSALSVLVVDLPPQISSSSSSGISFPRCALAASIIDCL
ncbi:MAG: hypothetical protein PUC86_05900 [Solobacterium sp.]|nr:hypothetical protein [Solobacterium sp.]MDD6956759.1 hypothetical protein [Solobacterium sp.]MDY5653642.1 hypothetical protein [Erysipelotrichaceae bacterium]